MAVFASYTLAFALQLRKKHDKDTFLPLLNQALYFEDVWGSAGKGLRILNLNYESL